MLRFVLQSILTPAALIRGAESAMATLVSAAGSGLWLYMLLSSKHTQPAGLPLSLLADYKERHLALQFFDPYRIQDQLTRRTGFSGLTLAGSLCLLLWVVPLIGHMEVASAQTPSSASGPKLPPPSTLRSGKLLRGPEGAPILVPPNNPITTSAAPAAPLHPKASTAEKAGETTDDGPYPPTIDSAANDPTPALPPPASSKNVIPLRLPGGELAAVPRTPRTLKVCLAQAGKPDCNYLSLAEAVAQAKPGDTVLLAPGIYRQAALVEVSNITIKGEPGAHLKGRAVEGKAALVVRADDVVIDGIECSEIRVRDRNGTCVRIEGRNLTIRNVYFHDNQEGVLGGAGGWVLIEDSVFENNGYNGGYAHGIYIDPDVEEFIFRRNKVLHTKDEGQGVKSRAAKTVIEDCVIASLGSRDSRAIDIPNGGEIIIRRNILQKGPRSANSQMIGLGLEGNLHPSSRSLIEKNVFIFDYDRPDWIDLLNRFVEIAPQNGIAVRNKIPKTTVVRDNVIIGAGRIVTGKKAREINNRLFSSRSHAGLSSYPTLPSSITEIDPN